jgi:hypothetical protein
MDNPTILVVNPNTMGWTQFYLPSAGIADLHLSFNEALALC